MQLIVCLTLNSYMTIMRIHTVLQRGEGYLEVIDECDAYCHANYRLACGKRLQTHLARDAGD